MNKKTIIPTLLALVAIGLTPDGARFPAFGV